LWIKPLADKKINEVNINVMERKRVLRKVQIPSTAIVTIVAYFLQEKKKEGKLRIILNSV
jgi:hypothetical protein